MLNSYSIHITYGYTQNLSKIDHTCFTTKQSFNKFQKIKSPQNVYPLLLLLLLSRFSHVRLRVTPWTAACQAPLFMEFSRQEYYSGLPCLLPGTLPNLGVEPGYPALQADSLPLCHLGSHISLEHLLINLCTQCDLSQFPGNSA